MRRLRRSAQLAILAAAPVDADVAHAQVALRLAGNAGPRAWQRSPARGGTSLSIALTLDSDHRLKSDPNLREAVGAVDAAAGEAAPDFYDINCSHAREFEPALEPGDWLLRLRSLRPNASAKDKLELCQIGHLEEGDPVDLGRRMGTLARRYPHIDIFGGCCGTWDRHLDEIARNVRPKAQ